jgi:DNA invertase Pin-like site-specific DNA recombinase
MRAATYSRVSTTEQSTAAQDEQLAAYCANRRWEQVPFTDQLSGIARRPGFDALLAAVRRREVGVVVITKLDRLARSMHQLVNISEELRALGVDLVVLDQAIDTTTPMGRLLFNVLGAIAEFERELIRERVLAGMARAKVKGTRSGKAIGRPRKHDVDARTATALQREGLSARAIARQLGVHHSAVARALA